MKKVLFTAVLVCLLFVNNSNAQVNGQIIEHSQDGSYNGYTILRVWCSYYDMGYAQGYLMADKIPLMIASIVLA